MEESSCEETLLLDLIPVELVENQNSKELLLFTLYINLKR